MIIISTKLVMIIITVKVKIDDNSGFADSLPPSCVHGAKAAGLEPGRG